MIIRTAIVGALVSLALIICNLTTVKCGAFNVLAKLATVCAVMALLFCISIIILVIAGGIYV